jgi:hypothetical protein
VRILKPFPERRTVVISRGDETSSRTEGNGSMRRGGEEEKGRRRVIREVLRRGGSVLER